MEVYNSENEHENPDGIYANENDYVHKIKKAYGYLVGFIDCHCIDACVRSKLSDSRQFLASLKFSLAKSFNNLIS